MHAQTSLATTQAPRANGFFMKRERRSSLYYIKETTIGELQLKSVNKEGMKENKQITKENRHYCISSLKEIGARSLKAEGDALCVKKLTYNFHYFA
jgi:hypothetical protein